MKETSPNSQSTIDRIRSWARTKAHGPSPFSDSRRTPTLPLSNTPSANTKEKGTLPTPSPDDVPSFSATNANRATSQSSRTTANNVADNTSNASPPPAPPPQGDGSGPVIGEDRNPAEIIDTEPKEKKNVAVRFWLTFKSIILSSYINLLLVFVPVGIASKAAGLQPGVVFGMNAIAIVPLAGLLSHATESVAKRMGDTIGALMNVTFGNAVELIIFIALTKNEIRIVQASLLGSILANLLLILGMCFLIGGLRFREQIYNSTVTQMSACLLSLSVMSLLLPTAFHASFSTMEQTKATNAVLKVSRGTSVILLLVYGMYLLFQLKSHAYMYESTPQHIIDEELAPGPVAAWMESSSDSSSSSSSDSDSDGSNTTAKRFKRVMRGGRRRRKSSFGSKDSELPDPPTRSPSFGTTSIAVSPTHTTDNVDDNMPHRLGAVDLGEDGDDENHRRSRKSSLVVLSKKERRKERERKEERERQEKKQRKRERRAKRNGDDTIREGEALVTENVPEETDAPRRVDFAVLQESDAQESQPESMRRPSNIRHITSKLRPNIPKSLSQNVFTQPAPGASPPAPVAGPIPRVRYGIRRTNSLPDRLRNQSQSAPAPGRLPHRITPIGVNSAAVGASRTEGEKEDEENISRTTAVVLLLCSTALVAVCAEFMVDSINAVVSGNSGLSEAFIGLIILPIVGNAAEHVTAVTVASKNKMDLAIGVAVGSSIQIALFVTPFVVLLGWCMNKDMSLYFTLFETVSLFVSAFIVNFLVLDGRSNYLEGALLCAAYIIIAVAAFFYPRVEESSSLGGNANATRDLGGMIVNMIGGMI